MMFWGNIGSAIETAQDNNRVLRICELRETQKCRNAMLTCDLDFDLPPELIAQTPPPQRTASRLLHYQRSDRSITHCTFSDLPQLLRAGDLLVFNNARVIPARFTLQKSTGGIIEGLFLDEPVAGQWIVLLSKVGRAAEDELHFADSPECRARVIENRGGGEFRLAVECGVRAIELLERIGRMPLPPYIKREKRHDTRDALDRSRYQTVFAREAGAVAAPTAALHFTNELFAELAARQIETAFVTLNVGMGTFKPVTADTLEAHTMHREEYEISQAAADTLNRAKARGARIIAVGTTSARVLESQPTNEPIQPRRDATSIFIYPPYQWRHVCALITNFHLPRSTLIALVAALTGLDEQRRIYAQAIAHRYRFFSYGDSMFVE